MNKLNLLFSLFAITSFAQVGIGTNEPKEQLHIAGENSTIRVEGLDSINNANNPGVVSQPLFVDAKGNLVLSSHVGGRESLLDYSIPFGQEIRTKSTGQITIDNIHSATFTLTQPAVVTIQYDVPFSIESFSGNVISDGQIKVFTSFINHTFNGSSTHYAHQTVNYSSTANRMRGNFHASGSIVLDLEPGDHTVDLNGWVMSAGPTNSANSFKAVIQADEGYLKIRASY